MLVMAGVGAMWNSGVVNYHMCDKCCVTESQDVIWLFYF